MHLRTLLIALLLTILFPILTGCAGRPIGLSQEVGYMQIPGPMIDKNLPPESVFVMAVNPHSERTLSIRRADGETIDYHQNPVPVFDAWGNAVVQVEGNRGDIGLEYAREVRSTFEFLIAQGFVRPPSEPGSPADNTYDAILRYLQAIESRLPANNP